MKDRFAQDAGIPLEALEQALPIEEAFHRAILAEPDPHRRLEMYDEVYPKVHAIYGKSTEDNFHGKKRLVRILKPELAKASSLLEIGCGSGGFLRGCSEMFPHLTIVGIDTSLPNVALSTLERIRVVQANVVNFEIEQKFDVIVLDNVWEHIAPSDQSTLLESINRALSPDGCLVVIAPNRLFGPSDVSRLRDYTYSNRIAASGTHLAEPSYSELLETLAAAGYKNFSSWLPFRKLKHLVPQLRVPSSLFARVESSKILMSLIYRLRWKQQAFLRFEVCVVARP